jgi:hypothetical protein
MQRHSTNNASMSQPSTTSTVDTEKLHQDSKLILQRLNQQYDHLGTAENILREELNNLKHEEELLRKALLQCRETGREQISRETKSTKLQDEALKNLHDVLMANGSESDDDDESSSSSNNSSDNSNMLQVAESFL